VEEEFEEEEVISGGYVPAVGSSSVVGPVSGPVSGQASGSVSNQAPIQVPVKSPVKVQKEIVQESEPTSNNPTLEKIAEKSVLLQKQEAYFIPALPVALISKRTVEVVETVEEEEESPIDDVTLDRFSKLEKIVQQRMVVGVTQVMQVTQVTKDAIKEDTRDALKTDKELIPPKRQTDQPQSSSKKGKWLDMILN
jgi:hypothetical protein